EATPAPGVALADLEQAIYSDIDGVKAGPIADAEIEKARNTARRRFMAGLESSFSPARSLALYSNFFRDPRGVNTRWDRFAKFNAADVQRVARLSLTPANRTVVISLPKPPAAAAAGGAR